MRLGRAVEMARLSQQPHDGYSGVLSQPHLLGEVAQRLGPQRVWSASQLNDYGVCGFRFFAKRLLKLDKLDEPEPGADALQMGSLYHRILERTYKRIAARNLPIHEASLDDALDIFAAVADEELADAPRQFNFRATASWTQEQQVIRARLAALIRQDFSADSPLRQFGGAPTVEALERRFDNLALHLTEDITVLSRGVIDRIDRVDGKLVAVDYKSGSTPIRVEDMAAGREAQMLVYTRALEALTRDSGGRVAGGFYWHLRGLDASGIIRLDDEQDQAALSEASQRIARNLEMGRRGQFPVHATGSETGKCVRYCEFSRLCRRGNTSQFKADGKA